MRREIGQVGQSSTSCSTRRFARLRPTGHIATCHVAVHSPLPDAAINMEQTQRHGMGLVFQRGEHVERDQPCVLQERLVCCGALVSEMCGLV